MRADKPVHRASLPLTEKDEQDLRRLRESGEYLRQLNIELTSEAAMLHAIHEAGVRAVP